MLPLAIASDWPLYVALVLLVVLVVGVVWIGSLLRQLTQLQGEQAPPSDRGSVPPAARPTTRAAAAPGQQDKDEPAPGELNLRRVEHLLVDVREGIQRLHGELLAVVQRGLAEPHGESRTWPVSERVVARLLAQGFERIEVLTAQDECAALESGQGEVLVEARRGGTTYKGRVVVQDGVVGEANLRASHTIFP